MCQSYDKSTTHEYNRNKPQYIFLLQNRDCGSIVSVDTKLNQIILKNSKEKNEPPKSFSFDAVFPTTTAQRFIYENSAFPLVESVLEGYNGMK